MQSRNSFSGIDPIVVKHIKYYSNCLIRFGHSVHESLEDIELKLFCEVWPYLNQYDETRSSFNTFVANLTRSRARDLLRNQLSTKRQMDFGIDENIPDHKCFESDMIVCIDIKNMISELPKHHRELCELLKVFSISKVSKITGIPKTTIYNVLKQIRNKFYP